MKEKLFLVVIGWIAFAVSLFICLYLPIKAHGIKDYQMDAKIWLPSHYIIANKNPDGTYFSADRVSVSGTAVTVPFDDSFKSLSSRSRENDIIVTPYEVDYLAKVDTIVYAAGYQYQTFVDEAGMGGDIDLLKHPVFVSDNTLQLFVERRDWHFACWVITLFIECIFIVSWSTSYDGCPLLLKLWRVTKEMFQSRKAAFVH
jgi:hypothetical protein